MPPVAQQQSSRGGLITALVIAMILAVVFGVFWMQSAGERDAARKALEDHDKKYKVVVGDMTSPTFTAVRERATDKNTVVDILMTQVSDLAKTITGTAMPAEQARKTAEGALTSAQDSLKQQKIDLQKSGLDLAPTRSLVSVINGFANSFVNLAKDRDQVQASLKAAQDAATAAAEASRKALLEKDKVIEQTKSELTKKTTEVETYRQKVATDQGALTQTTADQIKSYSDQSTAKDQAIAAKDTEIAAQKEEIKKLLGIARRFQKNTKENIVRQPDGVITRLPGGGYCFINRGMGDQVSVGMTFEVYDKVKGIPPLGEGLSSDEDDASRRAKTAVASRAPGPLGNTLDELPKGKGSIEVVSVGPGNTSQCRIVHVEPGQILSEGDVIANLVYDPKTKYNWVVYGDFDLDENGVPTSADTTIIRRLIEQWGGKIQPVADPAKPADSVTIDTDFIVMGMEPKVRNLTPEEQNDAQAVAAKEKSEQAKKAYDDVREKAAALGIPIMNQNRFLYYVGYYDQRRR